MRHCDTSTLPVRSATPSQVIEFQLLGILARQMHPSCCSKTSLNIPQEEYMKNFKMMTAALFAALLAFSTAGIAQQQQAAPTDVDVSNSELQSFAEARTAISEIQQDYSQRLQNVKDPETANSLQQQANEEMIGAVEETGLDVESFNTIAMAIQNDPELQQKLQQVEQ